MARIGNAVRYLALGLIPVALLLSHRNLTVVTTLLALSAVPALARGWRQVRVPGWAWVALALSGYLALSSLWTPSVGDREWGLRIPLFVLTVLAVVIAARRGTIAEARVFALAFLTACVLLGIEGLTGGLLRDLLPPPNAPDRDDVSTARGVGLAVAMLPAGTWWLSRLHGVRGRWLAAGAAVLLAIGAVRFGVAANALALVASGAAALLAWRAPRAVASAGPHALAAAFVLVPIAASLLPPADTLAELTSGPVSWRQRLVIWRTVADAALADPLILVFGAGEQSSAALGETAGTVSIPGSPVPLPRVPTHPHSVFLQVWYEAGAVGVGLAVSALTLVGRAVGRATLPRSVLVAFAATLAGAFVSFAVDASLWTLWRASALVLAAWGLTLAARATQDVVHRPLGP